MTPTKLVAPIFSIICFCSLFAATTVGQSPLPSPDVTASPTPTPTPKPKEYPPCPNPKTRSTKPPYKKLSLEGQFLKNILKDQCAIWTSPARLDAGDAKVLIPLGAITAGLISQDHWLSSRVGTRGSLPPISRGVSEVGTAYGLGGTAAAFYIAGHATGNKRAKETGLLAFQALINNIIVTKTIKAVMRRNRPDFEDGRGRFFKEGESFFSGHSSSSWAVATVIAYEYQDKPVVRYGAFAAAAAISLSRYSARRHFLSDILVGSAVGFYIGRYVYRTHHVACDDPSICVIKKPGTFTKLASKITPFYDARTRTFGGRFVWKL